MEKNSHRQFYHQLPRVDRLIDALSPDSFRPVPDDWVVLITDVVNSTGAIEAGRYKEVNSAGGLGIVAIANLAGGMEFPFVFGGDGMVMLLPEHLESAARDVMADTRSLVETLFGLSLRTGIVPVRDLYKAERSLEVARLRVSDRYDQAIIAGDGIECADQWVKTPGNKYLIPEDWAPSVHADFDGFSCRWRDIPSHQGITMAIIVRASSSNREVQAEVMRQLFETLEKLLGPEADYHPLSVELQKVSTDDGPVRAEAGAMARKASGLRFRLWKLWVRLQRTSTRMILRFGIDFPFMGKNIRFVREDNRINADYRKFDGTLKMVVACTEQTQEQIEEVLDRFHNAGFISYGTHSSDRAVMTCLVHVDSTREVHFVDAADGGYAMAAAKLKSQIAGESES